METKPPEISVSKIIKGSIVFIVITITTIGFLFNRSSVFEGIILLLDFNVYYLILGSCLVIFDWHFAAARIYVFAIKVQKDISYMGCLRAGIANIFMGGVTPSQIGGGLGQMYVLHKEGMKVVDAAVVSMMSFLSTIVILPACGIAISLFAKPGKENFTLNIISNLTMILFGMILLLVILSLINPKILESIIQSLLGFLPGLRKWLDKKGALHSIMNMVNEYQVLMMNFLKNEKKAVAYGFILTTIIYFNKLFIGYVVLKGLGITAPFWEIIYLHLLIVLSYYFFFTPGGSGGAEFFIVLILVDMGGVLPVDYSGVYVVLWRFFTLYSGMLGGAYVLMRLLLKNNRDAIPA